MVQTGDPTGTGKGGQSAFGAPFPDEVRQTLKVGIPEWSARGWQEQGWDGHLRGTRLCLWRRVGA